MVSAKLRNMVICANVSRACIFAEGGKASFFGPNCVVGLLFGQIDSDPKGAISYAFFIFVSSEEHLQNGFDKCIIVCVHYFRHQFKVRMR